jgi:hypothetical protein
MAGRGVPINRPRSRPRGLCARILMVHGALRDKEHWSCTGAVHVHGSSNDCTLSTTRKVGVRLWGQRAQRLDGDVFQGDCPENRSYEWAGKRRAVHIVVYCLSTDAGPDEANFGKRAALEVQFDVFT